MDVEPAPTLEEWYSAGGEGFATLERLKGKREAIDTMLRFAGLNSPTNREAWGRYAKELEEKFKGSVCGKCYGTGRTRPGVHCEHCGGKGYVPKEEARCSGSRPRIRRKTKKANRSKG